MAGGGGDGLDNDKMRPTHFHMVQTAETRRQMYDKTYTHGTDC